MNDLSKHQQNHENRVNAQSAEEKALQKARERLKSEGVNYPLYDLKKTTTENLGAIEAYGQLEAKYYRQFLAQPSGPRPLVIDNVKANKQNFAKPYKEWID